MNAAQTPLSAPAHAAPAPPEKGGARIASLDGLRGMSILVVVFGHLLGTRGFLPLSALHGIDHLANLGVRIFFVISGYLITSLLFHELDKTGVSSLKGFYLRRAFRIFPAFYAYLVVLLALRALGVVSFPAVDALAAATYTINYAPDRSWYVGHLWSLSVEEQFYLLWPVALIVASRVGDSRRGAVGIALAVIVAAPLIRAATWWLLPAQRPLIDEAFQTIADSIAFGCLLAAVRDRLDASPRYVAFLRSRWFFVVPVAIVVLNRLSDHPRVFYSIGETLLDLLVVIAVDRAVRFPDGVSGRFLSSPVMSQIGVLSYSIYLWQQLFLDRSPRALVPAFPLNLLAVAACALASYYVIERPMLRLRVRLFDPRASSRGRALPSGETVR